MSRKTLRTSFFVLLVAVLLAVSAPALAYTLGAGDVLSVSVWGQPDLSRDLVVRDDGALSLPTGAVVQVAGLDLPAAQAILQTAYQRWVKAPKLSLFVKEPRTASVSVSGEVRSPGMYRIPAEGARVTDAIAAAGGMLEDRADDNAVQVIPARQPSKPVIIDLSAGVSGSIADGDRVYVPFTDRSVTVQGEVARPGKYPVPRSGASLKDLIAQAGGPTSNGDLSRVRVVSSPLAGPSRVVYQGSVDASPAAVPGTIVEITAKPVSWVLKAAPYLSLALVIAQVGVALVGMVNSGN